MHEGLLEQLKQVHMELELKSQIITELHHKVETLTNQRQVAEARAGEALEEIVALKQLRSTLSSEMEALEKEKTHQMTHLRSELSSKEKKMALLRDAIIKLKEEFLKAQELQAEEIVRAASKRQHSDDDRLAALQDTNNKLQAKCSMLQEKVEAQTSELTSMANKVKRAQQLAQKQMSRPSEEIKQTIAALRDELSRYKAKLGAQTANDQAVVELSSRIKVLEAQNAALRQATPSAPNPSNQNDDLESSRKHWELEKKLKRRIEVLTTRLDEKKTEVDTLTTQCQRLKEQYSKAQSQVQIQAEQLMQLRTAPLPHLPRSRDDQQELESCHKRIQELQEQVLQQYKQIQPQGDIQKDLLEKDTLLLDLSFQVESLTLELQRVRRQTEAPTSRTPTKSSQKNNALEEVIENMKRAMEKLRNENERLRRNTKTTNAPKPVKVVDKAPALEQQLERKTHECIQLSGELAEIQRKHRLLLHKHKQLKDSQSDTVMMLRQEASDKDNRIEALERELSRKSPTTPANEEMLRKLEQHNAQLLEENAKLTEELSAFDLEFFEEIEDLKFKYAEAIRQKQWLERQLQRHH
ncbi:centrosome-associated protein [Thraustotheca clavata]|uniref:Centrosome-associated protein n=1 Tax=Thraustotheca clavata TaxID=74557 RepID=A0A1V9ZW89_9STRA|nr:centrosome-associated protein [Thraustotheca clavata]